MTRTFVLRTSDQGWITRNGGVVDSDGRVAIQVPASEVTEIAFAGITTLRTKLAELPSDYPNPWAVCPLPMISKWEEAMGR